jgi:hypothetical protein
VFRLLLPWGVVPFLLFGGDPSGLITFNDDGGWCWFEDERVIVHAGKLIIGTVAGTTGNIDVSTYDLATGGKSRVTLHRPATEAERRRWRDDHNSPVFFVRPDGRMLSMYAQHSAENRIYYRISAEPNDATRWQDEQIFVPSGTSRVTYSNLHFLTAENGRKGRLYDFFRGLNDSFKPSYAYSDDFGQTWTTGHVFIDVPTQVKHRPYVKYASNGIDMVHMAYTDGHPRNFDNSIYHVFYRNGVLHRSDGTPIRSLKEGLRKPEEGTRVYAGDPANVAWISDVHVDPRNGHPFLVFSVQKDSAGLPDGQAGEDHRFWYARETGGQWRTSEIAYAGSKLYAGEDDYTGLVTLDPHDPDTVFISTNADPVTGKPLISKADNQRHRELFEGRTRDGGATWRWTAITSDSTADNVRPIVPIWPGGKMALLWLRGKMRAYTDYNFAVVGMIRDRTQR